MRKLYSTVLLGLCLTGSGCSFGRDMVRNMANEPHIVIDDCVIKRRAHRLARRAWDSMVAKYGEQFSAAYHDGFIDGFADYIVNGGCTGGCGEEPKTPSVPPVKYRHHKYMNPEGYRAVEDWYMGFRHGASTAVASGLRNLVVIPVQNPPVFTEGRLTDALGQTPGPGANGGAAPAGEQPPAGEMLPPPRVVGPEVGPPPPRPAPPGAGEPPAPNPPAGNPPPAAPPGYNPVSR